MNHTDVLLLLREIGLEIQQMVSRYLKDVPVAERISVAHKSPSDVIYKIDAAAEEIIIEKLNEVAEELGGVVLVAEGIGENEKTIYPEGFAEEDATIRMIMDPIDGTRGIMYDKRSAFFLAGAAPNKGEATTLSDIEVAVMTELPTSRAAIADELWAVRGKGAEGQSLNLVSGKTEPLFVAPSNEKSIRGGFAQLSRFFPPGRGILAAMEDELMERLFPDADAGEILSFEDQYICSGGQLYEMLMGKDRFTADIRAALYSSKHFSDRRIGHVCHPYDLAAMLIAEESGLEVTDLDGHKLDCPMNTHFPANWIAYANAEIRSEVETVFKQVLKKHLHTV